MVQRVEEYRTKSLSLNMLYADFKIAFNNQNVVVAKISGDDEMMNAVVFSMSDGLLKVEGKLPGVEVDPRIVSISISNETIKINGTKLDKGKKLLIELSLPWSVELDVQQYALGSMEFTTDAGDVVLRNSGYMTIKAKSFNNITAYVSGMGDLVIDDLSASTGNFTVSGSGDVEICDGEIQDLTVITTDMGDFVFEGHAVTGSFTCSGMGDIEVDSCDNITKQKATGMGDIEVG